MSRPAADAGASGRLLEEDAARLGRGWVLQPKVDGWYVTVALDAKGRVESLRSRSGETVKTDLIGAFIGWPGAVLVGELEVGTERSTRAVGVRGYAYCYLHDCLRTGGGRYVGQYPYHARRDELFRMQSEVVNLAPETPFVRDRWGDAHDRGSGRYSASTPTDWRRFPIVEQLGAAHFDAAWAKWGPDADGEGLVAVNLAAPVGARGAKKKVKRKETLDAVVVGAGRNALRVEWGGHTFAISAVGHEASVGDVVSIAHEGWYERKVMPRCARLVRTRPDLG